MMRSKTSKDSSRGFQVSSEINFLISVRKALSISGQTIDGFQVSSEISFLISVRKALPTSGQTVDVTLKKILFGN